MTVDPGGLALTTTLAYDSAGNIASVTDARSNTRTATWDALRRLLQTDSPSALGYTVKYAYDARSLARELPPSPQRDAILRWVPGR